MIGRWDVFRREIVGSVSDEEACLADSIITDKDNPRNSVQVVSKCLAHLMNNRGGPKWHQPT